MLAKEKAASRGYDCLEVPQETVIVEVFDHSDMVSLIVKGDPYSEESSPHAEKIDSKIFACDDYASGSLFVKEDTFSGESSTTVTKAGGKILMCEDLKSGLQSCESHEALLVNDKPSITVGSTSTTSTYGSIESVLCYDEDKIVNASQEHSTHILTRIFSEYIDVLDTYPLPTTILTGAVLASLGDAIAQYCKEDQYSFKRGVSFALFDSSYRGLQHFMFPKIVERFSGKYLLVPFLSFSLLPVISETTIHYFAAMEQSLVNQVLIVPSIYFPAFFALTGAVQGLTIQGSIRRAKENYIPITLRTWLFWIPAQFVQFCFIPENLQVPFLCLYNLFWTIILSLLAGSIEKYAITDKHYCTTGMEDNCTTLTIQLAQQLMLNLFETR